MQLLLFILQHRKNYGDTAEAMMRKNTKARFVPIVIFPAIMPALMIPIMRSFNVSDALVGVTTGFCIGLAIVGLVWMVKRNGQCSTDSAL